MNKKETTKELNDFIVYNSEDILNLYNKEPELGNAFNLLLNALSKEYGSGENIEIKQPETQLETQLETKVIKVGDKVKLPLTKSAGVFKYEESIVIDNAKKYNEDYLIVESIIGDEIVLTDSGFNGKDTFSLSKDNIELYEEPKQFKEGDKVKIPKTKYGNTLIDFQVIKEAKAKNQDFLYISEIDGDKVELADDKYKTGIYFLFSKDNIELYEEPKKSVTNFKVGDKVKLPLTKSAGALSYDESAVIRNAKKNNQDYAFVSKIDKDVIGLMSADMKYTDSFSISKDNIQRYEEAEDFSKMTNDQLINKKNEIISAMSYFEEEDPEFQELAIQLEEISLYI